MKDPIIAENMIDELERHLKEKEDEFEAICSRCGACCGAYDGDRCSRLKGDGPGRYYCDAYGTRLGMQQTVSGKKFECVPIRDVLRYSYTREQRCAYLK